MFPAESAYINIKTSLIVDLEANEAAQHPNVVVGVGVGDPHSLVMLGRASEVLGVSSVRIRLPKQPHRHASIAMLRGVFIRAVTLPLLPPSSPSHPRLPDQLLPLLSASFSLPRCFHSSLLSRVSLFW
ncbi:hypothetical protein LIER_15022 [Lithospermum erythrorhizon]|uniref:Uncharacterized protein n=1 Tax=Lithospermum erythrorhizon TaxID=34254 RepID=A0AAV3Q3P6_LITER